MIQQRPDRQRLGEILCAAGVLTAEQLDRALKEQTSWGGRLGNTLLSLGFVDERTLASAIGQQLGLPTVDLDRAQLPEGVAKLLPLEIAEHYGLMPLGRRADAQRLHVACFDPTNAEALALARKATGLLPEVSVATASSIDRAIRRYYYGEAGASQTPVDPEFSVTRNTRDPTDLTREELLDRRVAALEAKVDRLTQLVQLVMGRRPE